MVKNKGWQQTATSPYRINCCHQLSSRLDGSLAFFCFDCLLANVDLDLLWLGFRLLRQPNLEHTLLIVSVDVVGVNAGGQSESPSKAAILALHASVILFLLVLFELALAVDGQVVVFHANVDILLIDPGHFDLQSDVVVVFVDIDSGRENAGGQRLFPAWLSKVLLEQTVHLILQGVELTERIPTS